jgi:hypothetical protein
MHFGPVFRAKIGLILKFLGKNGWKNDLKE